MCGARSCRGSIMVLGVAVGMIVAMCPRPAMSRDTSSDVPTLSLRAGETLAVIGIAQGKNNLRRRYRKRLQNRRIGFGLNQMLAEELFDTGKFRLLEEKEVRKQALIDKIVYAYWIEPGAVYSKSVLQSLAAQLGVTLLAYGNVAHAAVSGQRFHLGPWSRSVQKLLVKVEVCLYDASTGERLCREGKGEAEQKGTGLVYEFQGDRLDFETNAMGRASKQAVTRAAQALVTAIRFESS